MKEWKSSNWGRPTKSTVGHSCTRHTNGSQWSRWEAHINCPDWSTVMFGMHRRYDQLYIVLIGIFPFFRFTGLNNIFIYIYIYRQHFLLKCVWLDRKDISCLPVLSLICSRVYMRPSQIYSLQKPNNSYENQRISRHKVSSLFNLTYYIYIYIHTFSLYIYIIYIDIYIYIYIYISIFTTSSARAGYDTRSIFKWSLTGLNSEFSFS